MSEYQVSDLPPSVIATVNDELSKRANQERHYKYLDELQSMARELPRYYTTNNYRQKADLSFWNWVAADKLTLPR